MASPSHSRPSAPLLPVSTKNARVLTAATGPAFDRIVDLAADCLGAGVCVMVVIVDDRQMTLAVGGADRTVVPADVPVGRSGCAAIHDLTGLGESAGLEAAADARVIEDGASRSLETGSLVGEAEPMSFYAGVPICTPDDDAVGAFAIFDREPGSLSSGEHRQLCNFAALAVQEWTHQLREQTLLESRERYRTLVRNFPEGGVFLFDEDLRYTLAGGNGLSDVGLSEHDFRGKRPSELFPDAVARETEDCYRAAIRGEKRVFEQSFQGREYRIQTVPVYGKDGEIRCGMALSQNVTEQKERAEALDRTREEARVRGEILEMIFANAPLMFVLLGADGTVQETNAEWTRISGWESGDVYRVHDLLRRALARPEDRAKVLSFIKDAPNEWRTFPTRTADGDRVDTRWTFIKLSDERRIGIGIDVTERRQYEQELKQERDRLATLLDTLPTPVVHGIPRDDRFIVQTVNAAFEDVFGIEGSDLQGRDLHEVIVPDGRREQAVAINRRVVEEPSLQKEVVRKAADGMRPFRVQAAVREPEDGPPEVYALYADVSRQKRQEARLRTAKQEAEEAAQLKSAMLANMSHEVRTPLTSITGFSEMLSAELTGRHEQFAEMIHRNSRRLMQTLDSVLQLSKLDAGAYDLETTRIELGPRIREAVDMLEPKARAASVAVRSYLPDDPVVCRADAHAVDRILSNLLGNALKFTEAGGHIDIRARR